MVGGAAHVDASTLNCALAQTDVNQQATATLAPSLAKAVAHGQSDAVVHYGVSYQRSDPRSSTSTFAPGRVGSTCILSPSPPPIRTSTPVSASRTCSVVDFNSPASRLGRSLFGRGSQPVAAANRTKKTILQTSLGTTAFRRQRCDQSALTRGRARPAGEWPLLAHSVP
jgi:hypothetical protein